MKANIVRKPRNTFEEIKGAFGPAWELQPKASHFDRKFVAVLKVLNYV